MALKKEIVDLIKKMSLAELLEAKELLSKEQEKKKQH